MYLGPRSLWQNIAEEQTSSDIFRPLDNLLFQGIQGICDLMIPGLTNLDFIDVKAVMSTAGLGLITIGEAEGNLRAIDAARQAISNPLSNIDIRHAHRVLLNITGGMEMNSKLT